jgi:4-hydroxy-3-methylbut-2-enyl diphosphate reductase
MKVRRFSAHGGRGSILGALVHNERVVADFENLGLQTADDLDSRSGPTVVFSAHGVPPSTRERAQHLGLEILDTTCAFVADIHHEVATALAEGCHLVFVGDPEHREVVGYTHELDTNTYHIVSTMEDVQAVDWGAFEKIKIIFQTTLNSEEFEEQVAFVEDHNPRAVRADTICYASKENQDAARELAADPEVDLVLVIGGRHSANTRHLWEIAARSKLAHLIQGAEDIEFSWLEGVTCVGLTAGASTPDSAIDEVEAFLKSFRR